MALTASSPIPGIEKMDSMIRDPPIEIGRTLANTVIKGSNEFLKACFIRIFPSFKPLALAVYILFVKFPNHTYPE